MTRARQTADTIALRRRGDRPPPIGAEGGWRELPSLREIDLYGFQGLLKSEAKARHAAGYRNWHHHPERFEIDGHAPVRELWHRASLAWREILALEATAAAAASRAPFTSDGAATPASDPDRAAQASADAAVDDGPPAASSLLVVAHNNTNQALISTALGLPCTMFRRLVQSNAAVSSLLLKPGAWPGAAPDVSVDMRPCGCPRSRVSSIMQERPTRRP